LEVLVIEERGKREYPEKNLPEQGREPTTRDYKNCFTLSTRKPLVSGILYINKFKFIITLILRNTNDQISTIGATY